MYQYSLALKAQLIHATLSRDALSALGRPVGNVPGALPQAGMMQRLWR